MCRCSVVWRKSNARRKEIQFPWLIFAFSYLRRKWNRYQIKEGKVSLSLSFSHSREREYVLVIWRCLYIDVSSENAIVCHSYILYCTHIGGVQFVYLDSYRGSSPLAVDTFIRESNCILYILDIRQLWQSHQQFHLLYSSLVVGRDCSILRKILIIIIKWKWNCMALR